VIFPFSLQILNFNCTNFTGIRRSDTNAWSKHRLFRVLIMFMALRVCTQGCVTWCYWARGRMLWVAPLPLTFF